MGFETNNLDLSRVDSEDIETLASRIESFYKSDANVKNQLAWHWERNHLFLDGKHWLMFHSGREASGSMWAPLKVSKANEYIPRPTSNFIFDGYQTLKSYLVKDSPRSTVNPNTQTHKDRTAAKISNLCIEANFERLKDEQNYEYAAGCGVGYGTVFKKDYWDTTAIQSAKVPRMVQQPVIDPNSGMPTGQMSEIQAVDEMGDPVFDTIPLGDVNTCIVEPYRMVLDPIATNLHDCRWIMEYSIQSTDLIIELYGKEEPGYTGRAMELKDEKALSGTMQRFYQLKNSSGVKGILNSADAPGGNSQLIENVVVVKEYYERPSTKYPKGRLVVVANGITLYVGDSPYEGPELGDWHPYSDFRWEIVPGRFWGKSPIDDAVEIQKLINSIDSTIVLTRKTMAIPQKLIPLGSGVAPGQWTGRAGQEIFYRPDPSGAAPSTTQPTGVHETVFAERQMRIEDLKQIMGAIDILKGDRPPGVTAASALNMLYEVGTGKIFPALRRWKKFIESSQKKQLKLIAKYYKEPRAEFIKVLHAKNT
ncbi:MAG: hypothetical protein KGL39_53005, partial [Patescibacteria group bacterium]|nr:hypothetical protein [Patescibacteria group bacterium]